MNEKEYQLKARMDMVKTLLPAELQHPSVLAALQLAWQKTFLPRQI